MRKNQFDEITAWQRETFPQADAESKIAHLREEVEELSTAVHFGYGDVVVGEEFSDCLLLLFGAASAYGFTYKQICNVIDRKMEINKKRKWGKPDANGVVNHIRTQDELDELDRTTDGSGNSFSDADPGL